MSTEMTVLPEALMASIHAANLPSGGPDRPVPKIASTTAVASAITRSSDTSTPPLRNASSSREAAPRSRLASTQHTLTNRPQRCRCRAAASPSPALLPTPHTTAVACRQYLATCQPAASISQSTGMPKRCSASASTSLTWRLLSVGRALDDKGAVGVAPVDGVGLRDGGASQPRDELGSDGADLRKLERGVPERTVVDRHVDAFWVLGLLDQGAGAADPADDPV